MNDKLQESAISAQGLGKQYEDMWALRDFDLEVPTGSVLGLLGHNGAGKTTAIRMLTTLAVPTEGSAKVAGYDVVKDAPRVRERIGLTSQSATVDGLMSGTANLEMIGRLYHLPAQTARERAVELLERLGLSDVGDKLAKDYSGGMRRRLDLAASLVAKPPVLFLDEPTTGLDPESRNDLWNLLRELVSEGTTLLLTTQYLEEADQLADSIVLLDKGQISATGTPAELKARIGGERIVVTVPDASQLEPAAAAITPFADGAVETDTDEQLVVAAVPPETRLIEVVRALDNQGVDATDVHRREATLDDVFLSITGSTGRSGSDSEEAETQEVPA